MKRHSIEEETGACCAACDEPLTTDSELLTGFCADHSFAGRLDGDPRPLDFTPRHHTLADEVPDYQGDLFDEDSSSEPEEL